MSFSNPRALLPTFFLAVVSTVLVVGVGGCTPPDNGSGTTAQSSTAPTLPTIPYAPTTSTTTAASADVDYRSLLLTASDLTDAEDTFVERSRESQPDGSPGASAFFVNGDDNRAIIDTFMVYPDAATATSTLKQAAGTLPTLVTGGQPQPFPVGTDGVVVSGTAPDQDKAITLIFFAEGKALVRLEFQSAVGDDTTSQFVTNVAKMQQIALRVGLPDAK
ncbi:hypothetical protein H7K45_00335 [Mycobacterium yunnanensis]|uniref:Uncharacterized protein n=1 Tax=Mycobacterium yunnanensis TaxID=368477 RepID=A0A9X2YY05_9MYCO|nr:hypothetical protein [Mycobacterium yunnanensis]MCV7418982.1 hypothetical protein [Mycobacterium yunnanensis]